MLIRALGSLLISLFVYGTIVQAFECSYTTADGRWVYNELRQLDRTIDFTSFDGIFYYTLNVCGFSNNKNCSGVHGSVCTLTRDGKVIDAIGKYGAGVEPQWATTYESHPEVGITLSFENGMFEGKKTSVRLNLICDLGALTTSRNFSTIYTHDMFVMQLKTPYACPKFNGDAGADAPVPVGDQTTSTDSSSKDTNVVPASNPNTSPASTSVSPTPVAPSGLSGGAIFLILLLVIIPLYVGIGCWYKSQHLGTTGLESCPHIEFWQQVPKYVHDGCFYAYRRISSLFNRDERAAREEYDGL